MQACIANTEASNILQIFKYKSSGFIPTLMENIALLFVCLMFTHANVLKCCMLHYCLLEQLIDFQHFKLPPQIMLVVSMCTVNHLSILILWCNDMWYWILPWSLILKYFLMSIRYLGRPKSGWRRSFLVHKEPFTVFGRVITRCWSWTEATPLNQCPIFVCAFYRLDLHPIEQLHVSLIKLLNQSKALPNILLMSGCSLKSGRAVQHRSTLLKIPLVW